MAKLSLKSIDFQSVGLGILGAAAAGKVSAMPITAIPDKAKPYVPVILGLALMLMKNKQAKAAGLGMAIYGGTRALNTTLNLGLGGDASMGDYMIEGPDYALAGPDSDGTYIGAATETGSAYALAGIGEDMTADDYVG